MLLLLNITKALSTYRHCMFGECGDLSMALFSKSFVKILATTREIRDHMAVPTASLNSSLLKMKYVDDRHN